jgi:small subunit ribosomal protein S21
MLKVDLRDGESGDQLLNRFTKLVQKDGILREVKARRHFISAGERERIAQRKAAARRRRRKVRQRD